MNIEREIEIVNAFFAPQKRERYIEFLNVKKGRPKLLEKLYHFGDLDPNCVVELSGSCNSAECLLAELRRRGAADKCYVMSVAKVLDGVTEPLADIIEKVFASPVYEGSIVYCVSGTLAYYEGEAPKYRFILHERNSQLDYLVSAGACAFGFALDGGPIIASKSRPGTLGVSV